jgi:hypothetical protein
LAGNQVAAFIINLVLLQSELWINNFIFFHVGKEDFISIKSQKHPGFFFGTRFLKGFDFCPIHFGQNGLIIK